MGACINKKYRVELSVIVFFEDDKGRDPEDVADRIAQEVSERMEKSPVVEARCIWRSPTWKDTR